MIKFASSEVATDLESVVVELLEAELLLDADPSRLALKTDGFCLGRVLAVRSELQLDADIAGRADIQDNILEHYWRLQLSISHH